MPNVWIKEDAHLLPDSAARGIIFSRMGRLAINAGSIFAFREEKAVQVSASTSSWSNIRPSPAARRPAPAAPVPAGFARVGYTGIVDLLTTRIYLCPLAPSRGMSRYQGPASYANEDFTPIDHYSGQALDTLMGPGTGDRVLEALKANPQQRFALGRPRAVIGTHRIPGTRPSSSDPNARTLEAGSASSGDPFWDSAGHRQLVQRLRLSPESCVGFAVEKNWGGQGRHKLLFVSRLNNPHFGARGVSNGFANKIVDCLSMAIS